MYANVTCHVRHDKTNLWFICVSDECIIMIISYTIFKNDVQKHQVFMLCTTLAWICNNTITNAVHEWRSDR